jgi:hypothetical protein
VIELIEGHWFNPDEIVSVKSIAKDRCILWTSGQPATEGHILEYDAAEVVEAIEDCYNDDEDIVDEDAAAEEE